MKFITLPLLVAATLMAQTQDIKTLSSQGPSAIPQLAAYLTNADREVRLDAVRAILEAGTDKSIDPLILATQDADADVQIRATDGLVNLYVPNYYRDGIGASIKKASDSIKARFTDINTEVVPAGVVPREDAVRAIGRLIRTGATLETRANAARAAGILRSRAVVPDLVEGLKSHDTLLLNESLVAVRKIGDQSVNPEVAKLLKDPDEKIQVAALEALGVLGARDTAASVNELLRRSRKGKVRRMALTTLAMFANPSMRSVFDRYQSDKEDDLRAASAEGIARLRNAADLPLIERLLSQERKTKPKLSLAFAAVMLGRYDFAPDTPLEMLVSSLRSRFWVDTARPFLLELSRNAAVRKSLYPVLSSAASKDEKLGVIYALTGSGDSESIPHLEQLARDTDAEIAQNATRAVQVLRAAGH